MHKIDKSSCKGAKVIHTVDLGLRYQNIEKLSILNLATEVQLSNCVLAMTSHCSEDLKHLCSIIKRNHFEFKDLYRGTGARYLTKSRLEQWLIEKGACILI